MHRVFSRPRYALLATLIALCVYLVYAWSTVIPLFLRVVFDVGIPLADALSLGETLFIGALFSTPPFSVVSALLIGINAALLVFYVCAFRTAPSSMNLAGGLTGAIAALLGLGCAACGSIFLASLVSALSGTGLVFFPFGGAEINVLGMMLLVVSAFSLARAINRPRVCPI